MAHPFSQAEGEKFAEDTKGFFFLGSEAGRHYGFNLGSKPTEVFPGIMSDDPRFLKLCTNLPLRFAEELPKKVVLDNGFFDSNAVTTNFFELNTVSGMNMVPATYAVIDNSLLRQSMSLNDNFESEEDLAIFHEYMAIRYKEHDGSRGKISKISSSTFPFFSKDVRLKANHLSLILKHQDEIKDLLNKGDLQGLFDKYKLLFAMVDVYRSQADSFSLKDGSYKPKDREVNDIEYSISGGKLGKRFFADKSVVINGRILDGKAACRARTAYGFSNAPNLMFTAAFEGFRHYADTTYGMTFKHTSREAILEKMNKYSHAVAVDVTQYDQSIPFFLMKEWINCSPFNKFGKELLSMMVQAPMFYRGPSKSHKPYWSGDPLDIEYFNQYRGLISGLFSTSAMGKDFFTFTLLTILNKIYGDVRGNVEKILKWEHPVYAITNMGDDSNLHSNDSRIRDYFTKQVETQLYGVTPYFKVDIEDGFKFLGNIGYIDNEGNKQLCGDLGSYFKNMLVPERSISSKHRKYGVYGLLERRSVYSSHPLFSNADAIFQSEFKNIFGFNWLEFMESHLVMPEAALATVLTQAEIEVINDPSKLHYKYNEDEISSAVVEIIEERISEENTELAINMLIK